MAVDYTMNLGEIGRLEDWKIGEWEIGEWRPGGQMAPYLNVLEARFLAEHPQQVGESAVGVLNLLGCVENRLRTGQKERISLRQGTKRLPDLAQMIGGMDHDCQGAANGGLVFPSIEAAQHGQHSPISLFELSLESRPFFRCDFSDRTPDFSPINVAHLLG
jgi:hypothetical protein